MSDLVSVGFLVFNDIAFLRRALDSLLSQTHSNLEILICDDGSTDGSAEVCREYAQADPRIRYLRHEPNIGISRNMELALAKATGPHFLWAADDDVWDPRFVERLLQALRDHPDCTVAFCPYQLVDENDVPLPGHEPRRHDYSAADPIERIRKLGDAWDDGFGYGLFRRDAILDVSFPIWWWVNRATPLNNIYPSLCFYLARGNFHLVDGPPLWFNRIKTRPNHNVAFHGEVVRSTLAGLLRHLNCHVKCVEAVHRGGHSARLTIRAYPALFRRLLVQVGTQLRGAGAQAALLLFRQMGRVLK